MTGILRVAAVSLACAFATTPIAPAASAPDPALTVAKFLALHPASGRLTLVGIVVDLYACPPCPARAECKPCEGDHIVVADEPPHAATPSPANTIAIFVRQQDLQALPVGGRFRLETEISPAGVRLISAQKIP